MKICNKCGAHNSDNKIFCVDCNETLGEKLSVAEEQEISANISGTIEKMYNRTDPLYVSKSDKFMGVFSAIGAIVSLILIFVSIFTHLHVKLLLCAMFLFLIATVESLFPQVSWALEKIRLSFTAIGTDDLVPGNYYNICRKITVVAATVFGVGMLVLGFMIT